MITLTTPAGHPVAINPLVVFAIEQDGPTVKILSPAGHTIWVTETFADVEKRLKAWVRG